MKLRFFVYRLAAILTAFLLGVGIFNAGQYLQSFFQAPETVTAEAIQPAVKKESLYVPPWAVPSPLSTPKPYVEPETTVAAAEEETPPEFSPDGYYYIVGDVPKGFQDIENINVTTTTSERVASENRYETVPVPPEGFLWTEKRFDFDSIDIDGKRISFETEAKKGVSYKFVGEFIDEERIQLKEEYFETVVLKGRLIKMRDGKKIAESKVKLAITHGC